MKFGELADCPLVLVLPSVSGCPQVLVLEVQIPVPVPSTRLMSIVVPHFWCRYVSKISVPCLRPCSTAPAGGGVEVHSLQEGASNGWKMYRNVYKIVIIFCDSDDFSDFKGAAKLSFIYAMYQVYIDSGDNEESCQILDSFAVSVGIAEMGIVTLRAAPPQDFLRPGAAPSFEKCYGQFWRSRRTKWHS